MGAHPVRLVVAILLVALCLDSPKARTLENPRLDLPGQVSGLASDRRGPRPSLGSRPARAVAATQKASAPWTIDIRRIDTPAATGSAQPHLSVSNRGVLVSWVERTEAQATLKFAERTKAGWSQPRVVASGDDWFVNWADVPSVVRLANGTLAAHWLQKSGPGTYAYDVRLSYSADDGATWAPSFTPHHDGTRTEHGFASLFQMPGGGLGLIWLDGRAMTGPAHDGHEAGDMSIRFAAFDQQWKQTSDTPFDTRVCECCSTSAAITSEGVVAAFRDRSAEEVRDISVSRFSNGRWSEPKPVFNDGWRIPACPVNGPMLAANGRDVAVAWFTVKNEGNAYVAFSKDAGRTFGKPLRLDDSATLGRVDLELLPDGSALATWLEVVAGGAELRIRRLTSSGHRSAPVVVATLSGARSTGFPRLARNGHELVFAWTDSQVGAGGRSVSQVQTAVAQLPPK